MTSHTRITCTRRPDHPHRPRPHRAAAARAAGLSDKEIAETIGHVARGALDFPAVAA